VKPQAQRLNCLPPSRPSLQAETREALRRPRRTLSTPHRPPKPTKPAPPLPISFSKTWHSYPPPLAIIEVAPNRSSPQITKNSTARLPPPKQAQPQCLPDFTRKVFCLPHFTAKEGRGPGDTLPLNPCHCPTLEQKDLKGGGGALGTTTSARPGVQDTPNPRKATEEPLCNEYFARQ